MTACEAIILSHASLDFCSFCVALSLCNAVSHETYCAVARAQVKAVYDYFRDSDWYVEWLGKQLNVQRWPVHVEGQWTWAAAFRVWD